MPAQRDREQKARKRTSRQAVDADHGRALAAKACWIRRSRRLNGRAIRTNRNSGRDLRRRHPVQQCQHHRAILDSRQRLGHGTLRGVVGRDHQMTCPMWLASTRDSEAAEQRRRIEQHDASRVLGGEPFDEAVHRRRLRAIRLTVPAECRQEGSRAGRRWSTGSANRETGPDRPAGRASPFAGGSARRSSTAGRVASASTSSTWVSSSIARLIARLSDT